MASHSALFLLPLAADTGDDGNAGAGSAGTASMRVWRQQKPLHLGDYHR